MAKKNRAKSPLKIVIARRSPGKFEPAPRNGSDAYRIVPTKRSKLRNRELDPGAALDDYLAVLSHYALWEEADRMYRFADDQEIVTTFKLDVADLRQRGKHRQRLHDGYLHALLEATNLHGPFLADSDNISDILSTLKEFRWVVVPEDQLSKIPGSLGFSSEFSQSVMAGKIREAMMTCELSLGRARCPDVYSALCWYVFLVDPPVRVCDVCKTAFVSRRGRTCSSRCRQRLHYAEQKRNRKPA